MGYQDEESESKIEAFRRKSEELFRNANTLEKFLSLWSSFYDDEIFIPSYLSYFKGVSSEYSDDRNVVNEAASLFKKLTNFGFIFENSQPNESETETSTENKSLQRAYVTFLCPRNIANNLCVYVSRNRGFFCYHTSLHRNLELEGIWVSYFKSDGDPCTKAGGFSKSVYEDVTEWCHPNVKDFILNNYRCITIIDTLPNREPNSILHLLENYF